MNSGMDYVYLKSPESYTPIKDESYDFKFEVPENVLNWKLQCILNFNANEKTWNSIHQESIYTEWKGSFSNSNN